MPFLITGNPRSGTHYIQRVLGSLGHKVNHERNGKDGVVSWYHVVWPTRFKVIAHQLRDPLKSINSPISYRTFDRYFGKIGRVHNKGYLLKGYLLNRMHCWIHWHKYIEMVRDFWYRIEDFDECYPEVFKKLGLEVPDKLPAIPKNKNTRINVKRTIHMPEYYPYTWKDMENEDKHLANLLRRISKKYGY